MWVEMKVIGLGQHKLHTNMIICEKKEEKHSLRGSNTGWQACQVANNPNTPHVFIDNLSNLIITYFQLTQVIATPTLPNPRLTESDRSFV